MSVRTLVIVIACTLILFVLIPNLASRSTSGGDTLNTQQNELNSETELTLDGESSEFAEEYEEIVYEETDAAEEDWQNVDTDYSSDLAAQSQAVTKQLNSLNVTDIRLEHIDYMTERNGLSVLIMNDGSERRVNQFEREKLSGDILVQLERSYED